MTDDNHLHYRCIMCLSPPVEHGWRHNQHIDITALPPGAYRVIPEGVEVRFVVLRETQP